MVRKDKKNVKKAMKKQLSDLAAAGIDIEEMLRRGGFLWDHEVRHPF